MNRIISLITCLIILTTYSGYGKNVNQLLKKLSKIEGVNKLVENGLNEKSNISVGDIDLIKDIHSVEIYTVSESCSNKMKKEIIDNIRDIEEGGGYISLTDIKNDETSFNIMIRKKRNKIRNLVIMVLKEEVPVIIKISGK